MFHGMGQGTGMKHILIVDDCASGRHLLREWLELQGYACREVEHGSEALKAIQKKRFDLVITDHQMPVMTGLQFLQRLAESPDGQRPPVIFLTGQASVHVRKAAQAAGAHVVLQKPCNERDLSLEITKILKS